VTPKRIVIAMTGASGAVYGVRLLEALRELEVETHLVMTVWGERTLEYETDYKVAQVRALATEWHAVRNQSATIASGSFRTDGMIVAPCSARTLAGISTGVADNLVCRAADVTMKERRRLVLLVRETPLHEIHLKNMLRLTRMGVVVAPPVPAFYALPDSISALVDHTVGRTLDLFGLDTGSLERWNGSLAAGER
jgi:phenylacrylic acid decarboxylase